ncbi:MAG: hypothetical protein MUP90_13330 [Gammaproteobacteria bacterium]|nr:hypothetical protein [Gammaproteobacteria bacterium]
MTNLSPAAHAVLDAYVDEDRTDRLAVAAALRAVADQVVPYSNSNHLNDAGSERQYVRRELLAIAAELEGAQ